MRNPAAAKISSDQQRFRMSKARKREASVSSTYGGSPIRCRVYPIKVTKHAVEAKVSGRCLRNQMIFGMEYMGCVTNPVI